MFNQMCNDTIKIINPNGVEFNNIKANVQKGKIFVFDQSVEIQDGAEIIRLLPKGNTESYYVIDNGYVARIGIEAHYQCVVKKKNLYIDEGVNPGKQTITINATQSNVNLANNHSQIQQSNNNQVFKDIINKIESDIYDVETRNRLIMLVKDLEISAGMPSFTEKYDNLITSMANHITILTPFIPILAQYLR